MLTKDQISLYRTFGFLVLRRHLDPNTMTALTEEVDRAFLDAFGNRCSERPNQGGGIEGHYLPVMSGRTPISRRLVEDERFFGVAEELLGALPLPTYAEAILYFGQSGMHDDYGLPVTAVKFFCYLVTLRPENGALRLLPGSHHAEFGASVRTYLRRHPANDHRELQQQTETLPCFVAESEPGDVIAFDAHVFHGSIYGQDRRQWTVTFHKDPSNPEELAAYGEWLEDEVRSRVLEGQEPPYEFKRYPLHDPMGIADHTATPARRRFVPRMRELGVFEALAPWSR